MRDIFIEFHPIENRDARIALVTEKLNAEGLITVSERRRAFIATREP